MFHWERRVEFCETDAAGIVHFSSFFLYTEQAEHALFRSFGSSIFPAGFHQPIAPGAEPAFTWPRVRCECEYLAPAHFEETLFIDVGIERLGAKSVTYAHRITRDGVHIAQGRTIAVCSRFDAANHRMVGYPIPETLRASLSKYLIESAVDLS